MPKQTQEINSFVGGLFTEATPLTSPPNTCTSIENFEIKKDGSVRKRDGMRRFGTAWNFTSTSFRTFKSAINTSGGDVKGAFILDGGTEGIIMYDPDVADPMSTFAYVSGPLKTNPVPILDGFVVASANRLHYITPTTTVLDTGVPFLVRDIWGVDDGLELTERPLAAALTNTHQYNCYNQGWLHNQGTTADSLFVDYASHFAAFGSTRQAGGRYPSNADLYSLGTDANGIYTAGNSAKLNTFERPAPKGKFIIDLFTRGASRANRMLEITGSTFTGLPVDEADTEFQQLASYAGRLWAAGAVPINLNGDSRSPSLGQMILFSQVIKNETDINKFYQQNDPTDPDVSDLLPTDGGVLELPDIGMVTKLAPMSNGLLVVAENSVRFITGPDGVFRADDYSVELIANVGAPLGNRVAILPDAVMFESQDGIYRVAMNPNTGRMQATNMTRNTIDSYYREWYDPTGLHDCIYDEDNNLVKFIRIETTYSEELIYDLDLQAFYVYKFTHPTANQQLVGLLRLRNNSLGSSLYLIQEQGLSTAQGSLTASESYNFFKDDFGSFEDYTAHLTTGYTTFGDTQRDKMSSYITTHFDRSETQVSGNVFYDSGGGNLVPYRPSSCTVQSRWNFSNTGASGKFGTPFEAYRYVRPYIPSGVADPFDWGESVISTKHRIRGSGKALQLHFESAAQKDCQLLGWGMLTEGQNYV